MFYISKRLIIEKYMMSNSKIEIEKLGALAEELEIGLASKCNIKNQTNKNIVKQIKNL